MNINIYRTVLFAFFILAAGAAQAQISLPEGSQRAQITQRIGITDITIDYGRPSVRDRELWGKLVPYGFNNLGFGTSKAAPWRAGANKNTTIEVSHGVMVEGKDLPAGKYGFHVAFADKDNATIIFSKDTEAWGSYFYNPDNDALRVDVKTREASHKELLTFEFNTVKAEEAVASLRWGKLEIPFSIQVPVKDIVLNKLKADFTNNTGFVQSNVDQGAAYAFQQGETDLALEWVTNSIENSFFGKPTYNNLSLKTQILMSQGKEDAAEDLVDDVVELGNATELYQFGSSMQAAGKTDLAVEIGKANVKKHNGAWPSNYGLARAYAAEKDYKKAAKAMKKAHSGAPERFKDRLAGELGKLEKGEPIN